MNDLEKSVNEKAMELIDNKTKNIDEVGKIITDKVNETDNVKTAIDLLTTKTALQQEGVVEKLVDEKEQELVKDAETKKINAETEKLKKEKEKEIAEFDKIIYAKQKEIEQLKVEADRAEQFFKSNEEILSCIGIQSAKSLKVMYFIMPIAIFVFVLIRFIALPLTICGKLAEIVIDVVGGICKKITNNALKIVISILVIALLIGGSFCAYYFGGKAISNI